MKPVHSEGEAEVLITIIAPTQALRAGLRALLADDPHFIIHQELGSVNELTEEALNSHVLIVASPSELEPEEEDFLSELLPDGETLPGLLLLSDEAGDIFSWRRLPLAAWGLLPSDASAEELISAVLALRQGLFVGAPHLMERLLLNVEPAGPALSLEERTVEALTAREREVLQLLAQGLANKQIALALNISEHTVKFHVSSIYTKLGAANRTEAVRMGVRQGIITL